ncbi:hypothetical protein HOD30_00405 [Candidatus Peregrinibacteria bacterium]|jgi:hypothetical protein|nr:hypothetical protein [Candidatus Peregrinibacteria bacterium]MBT4631996.1 hypothetical protein [Candidatus Peregrinibacteria bacterium]MBT5516418.1 hypothetical protein [Candidatus Peregrinibacteria bacterium]MBT5823801.1 hypothetical protein [Candidatus Peregrinibacteria bacterium]
MKKIAIFVLSAMLLSACEFVVPYSITFTTQEGSIVNPDSDTLDLAINHEAYAYISRLQCDENDPVELLPVLKEDVSASKAHNLSLNLLADQVDGARCEVTVSAYDQTTTSSSHEEIFVFVREYPESEEPAVEEEEPAEEEEALDESAEEGQNAEDETTDDTEVGEETESEDDLPVESTAGEESGA